MAKTTSISKTRKVAPLPDDDSYVGPIAQLQRYKTPLSRKELAPILGVSPSVLYRMATNGKIPTLVLPGTTTMKFEPVTIIYWLRKHNTMLNQALKAS